MGNQKPLLWTAILTAAGTGSAVAQITGTPVAGDYYFKDVATGKFLGGANNWGTQASLIDHGIIFKVAASNGTYTLDSNTSNGGNNHYFTGTFVDGAAANVKITETDTKGQYLMQIGDKYVVTDGNIVTSDGTDAAKAVKWQIIPVADLKKAFEDATFENPADATFLIKGANFARNWGENSAWKGTLDIGGSDKNNDPLRRNWNAENFNKNFDVYQEITDVPTGLYRLTVQAFYRGGNNDVAAPKYQDKSEVVNALLYANDQTGTIKSIYSEAKAAADADKGFGTSTAVGYVPNSMKEASLAFSAGLYKSEPVYVFVSDGKLKVGIKKTVAVTNDWTIFDNFELAYIGSIDVAAVKKELQEKLAVQINKASVNADDEDLKALKLEASTMMADLNSLTDDPKAETFMQSYLTCANYISGVKGNIGEQIDELGDRISAANENYEAYQAALNGHADLETYLQTLTDTYNGAAPETQTLTKSLYEGIVKQVADFKVDAEKSYQAKKAASEFSDANIKTKSDNIKKAIDDAVKAIASGSSNAISYANVSAKVAEAKNAYNTSASELYDLLAGAKKDGDIYNDTYVAALADLNTYLRAINEVDADNKAAYDAEKANEDTQAAFEKKLADAVAAMPSVYDKYVAQVGAVENPAEGTLRANYAAASEDVAGLTESLDNVIKGVDKSITNAYAADIKGIQDDIKALQGNVDAANKAHTIKGTAPFCDGYSTDKAAIEQKISTLQSKVAKAVEEFNANKASETAIKDLQKKYDDTKAAVQKLVSDDKKYDQKTRFATTEGTIQAAITKLNTDAAAAYKVDGTGTAVKYNNGLAALISAIEGNINDYQAWADASLAAYNTIAAALTNYDALLNGTPAVGEEGKDGYVAATPGLKGTATNQDVTIDGTLEGTSYKDAIAAIEKDIAAVQTALDNALKETDKKHFDAITKVDVKASLASTIETLTNDYADNETTWNANQLAKAKENLLNEADTRVKALTLGDKYDKPTYGKATDDLNKEYDNIAKALDEIQKKIDEAKGYGSDKDTEAIALLSQVVKDLAAQEKAYNELQDKAAKAKTEYAADQAALTALLASVDEVSAKLNGGTYNKVEYPGVAKTDGNQDRFTTEISNVQTAINTLIGDLNASGTAETVRADQKDTKEKLGFDSRISLLNTQVTNLLTLATAEAANDKANEDFTKAVAAAKVDPTTAENDIKAVSTGAGQAYFLSQLDSYKNEYDKIIADQATAYAAKAKSTLDGALKDNAKYTDTQKNMVAQTKALTDRLNAVKANIDGLKAQAEANEKAHTAQTQASAETLETWNKIFATITNAEASQAHEAAIATLTEAKKALDAYDKNVSDDFATGKCDTDKAKLQSDIDAINRKLKELNDGWDDAYKAAIAADNAERKGNFDKAYENLTKTYQESTELVNKLSKLSYAAGETETLLDITGEGGIYSKIDDIRKLKTDADKSYNDTDAPDLWDAEETYTEQAKGLEADVKGLADQYADAVNNIAMNTYNDEMADAQSAIDFAKGTIGDVLGLNAKAQKKAVADAQAIVDGAKGEIKDGTPVHSDFAYILDTDILPKLATIDDLLDADMEKAAVSTWNTAIKAANKLAQAEQSDINGYAYEGAEGDAQGYADFVEGTVNTAAEVWKEIPEGEKFENYADAFGILSAFINDEVERDLGTAEKPNKVTHTNTYWDAYDKQKAYEANNTAYAAIMASIDALQKELDAAEEFVGSLLVEHNENLNVRLNNVQGEIDDLAEWAESAHTWKYAVDAETEIKNRCKTQSEAIKGILASSLEAEKAAVNVEIGQLIKDYDLAVAKDIANTEVDKYKDIIAGYQKQNDRIYADFSTGKVDKDGKPILDKNNNPVKATADETKDAFIALEKQIGQTKSELTAIYDEAATAEAIASVEKAIAGLQETYDALEEQLKDCHDNVVETFQPAVDLLKDAIDAAQAELDQEKADNTVLLYADNNIASAEKVAKAYEGLSDQIKDMEDPYDTSDAKYLELAQVLSDLQARLDAVKAKADGYAYKQEGTYGDEDQYSTYGDYRYAELSEEIAGEQTRIENLRDAYRLNAWSTVDDSGINSEINSLEQELAVWNADRTIDAANADLSTAYQMKELIAGGGTDKKYTDSDNAALDAEYLEVQQKINNVGKYNWQARFGEVEVDLDGNVTYDEDGNVISQEVNYMEEYDAIMEKADALADLVKAYADHVEANAYLVGDPDQNGKINVNDYNYVRNIVIGALTVTPGSAKFAAADITNDNEINIQDVTKVANMIMTGSFSGAGANVRKVALSRMAETEVDSRLFVTTAGSGTRQQVVIAIDNSRDFVGAQMDITLPAGVSIVGETGVDSHDFLSGTVNGAHRVLISSLENSQLNAETLVTLDVEVSADYKGGAVEVSNAIFSDALGKKYVLGVADMGEATGIAELTFGQKAKARIYSVGGQLLGGLKKGYNLIVNPDGTTKKVYNK